MSFIMKKKKYKFQVEFEVDELSSVPLVNAVLFAKIRLIDGGFVDTSSREEVTDHCVKWNAKFSFPCKMSANASTGLLDPCVCRVSIRKELKGGKSFQKLGFADVNLAEFAGSGTCSRCYLLEGYDAKHRQDNSTLKVTLIMTLLSGDPCFKVPSTRPHMLPGEAHEEHLQLERPMGEEPSGGSLTSGSSGIGSLPRKQRPNVLKSDLVSNNTNAETEGNSNARGTSDEFELTHSRNSSYTSQQSKASGYSSMHSRQSSAESGHIRNPSWPGRNYSFNSRPMRAGYTSGARTHSRHSSLDFVPGHFRNPSTGSAYSDPNMPPKPSDRKRKQIVEDPKESRVDATRVNADDLIDEIIKSADLVPDDSAEPSGLMLYVSKDGTATLGSHEMQSRMTSGVFEAVVIDNR